MIPFWWLVCLWGWWMAEIVDLLRLNVDGQQAGIQSSSSSSSSIIRVLHHVGRLLCRPRTHTRSTCVKLTPVKSLTLVTINVWCAALFKPVTHQLANQPTLYICFLHKKLSAFNLFYVFSWNIHCVKRKGDSKLRIPIGIHVLSKSAVFCMVKVSLQSHFI